jgi:hypothetical protein
MIAEDNDALLPVRIQNLKLVLDRGGLYEKICSYYCCLFIGWAALKPITG